MNLKIYGWRQGCQFKTKPNGKVLTVAEVNPPGSFDYRLAAENPDDSAGFLHSEILDFVDTGTWRPWRGVFALAPHQNPINWRQQEVAGVYLSPYFGGVWEDADFEWLETEKIQSSRG